MVARMPFIPTGCNWNIGLHFTTEAVLQKHQKQRVGYQKAMADLRSKLRAGSPVQILAVECLFR